MPLIETSREPRTEDRARDGGCRTDAEKRPVDTASQVSEQSGDTEAEPDGNVRADRPEGICSDETKERRKSQRPEDEPDESAQQSNHRTRHDRRTRTWRFLARRTLHGCLRPDQIDPEGDERDADRDQQGIARHVGGDECAGECSCHRRRCHPGEQTPVDAACANVGQGRPECGSGRDPDVRAGSGRRARGRKNDDRKANVPQNQANQAARKRGGEAPDSDGDEEESVQSLEYLR